MVHSAHPNCSLRSKNAVSTPPAPDHTELAAASRLRRRCSSGIVVRSVSIAGACSRLHRSTSRWIGWAHPSWGCATSSHERGECLLSLAPPGLPEGLEACWGERWECVIKVRWARACCCLWRVLLVITDRRPEPVPSCSGGNGWRLR